jgi:hypothetical protein
MGCGGREGRGSLSGKLGERWAPEKGLIPWVTRWVSFASLASTFFITLSIIVGSDFVSAFFSLLATFVFALVLALFMIVLSLDG